MKRIMLAAVTAATLIAPLGVASTAAADPGHGRGRGHERGWDRHDRDNDYRNDRRDERRAYHDGRRDGRYAANHHRWRRGDRLPSNYRSYSYYRDVDYRAYRLRQPPRGYHYVRDDNNGEFLLVGITTGIILGAILAGY